MLMRIIIVMSNAVPASAPLFTADQLSALRRFDAGGFTAEDVPVLLAAGLVRPADGLELRDQLLLVLDGKLPELVMTGAGRAALKGAT